MASVWDYSTTAASNNSASPDGAPEGMAPSGVNNAMREHMARSKGAVTGVAATGTDTYAATLAPAPTALTDGMTVHIRFANANATTTPTLEINSLGAKTIVKQGGSALVAGDIPAGHEAILRYVSGSTEWELLNPAATLTTLGVSTFMQTVTDDADAATARATLGVGAVGGNVLAPHENLIVKQVTSATVDINADTLLVRNSSRDAKVLTTADLTVDISASAGANALDTGTEASSTWYHLWVIAKADGTVAGLISTSSSSPTMPTGYTFKGYVGAVYNNASSNFVAFHQIGNLVAGTQTSLLSAANGVGSLTSVSLSAAVPTTAKEVSLTAALNAESTAGDPSMEVASTSAGLGKRFIAGGYSNGTSGSPRGSADVPLVESQTVYWSASFTTQWNVDLKVTGWRY